MSLQLSRFTSMEIGKRLPQVRSWFLVSVLIVPSTIRVALYRDAFDEARGPFKSSWLHPAVLEARMSAYGSVSTFLRRANNPATRDEAYEKFREAYRGFVDMALDGKRMPHGAHQSADDSLAKPVESKPSDFDTGQKNWAGMKDLLNQ